MSGNKKENVISEHQSFTDLTYSKNKARPAPPAPSPSPSPTPGPRMPSTAHPCNPSLPHSPRTSLPLDEAWVVTSPDDKQCAGDHNHTLGLLRSTLFQPPSSLREEKKDPRCLSRNLSKYTRNIAQNLRPVAAQPFCCSTCRPPTDYIYGTSPLLILRLANSTNRCYGIVATTDVPMCSQ